MDTIVEGKSVYCNWLELMEKWPPSHTYLGALFPAPFDAMQYLLGMLLTRHRGTPTSTLGSRNMYVCMCTRHTLLLNVHVLLPKPASIHFYRNVS